MTTIRLADVDDEAAVRALAIAAYEIYLLRMGRAPAPMTEDYNARIKERAVHVLDVEGTIAGFIVLLPEANFMLLDNVAVDPALQGHGYGSVLLDFAERQARAAAFQQIRLYTHETMIENIERYRRRGYIEFARIEEKGFRRVYMVKNLAPA